MDYKISVILCSYNGENHIEDQLKSISKQTIGIDEIIIKDDCSKDSTIKLVKNFVWTTNLDVRILVNEVNKGFALNFIEGLYLANGDLIFLCDQDDIWELDKVEKIVQYANRFKDIDVFCSDGLLVDHMGFSLNKTIYSFLNLNIDSFNNQPMEFLRKRNYIIGAGTVLRKSFLEQFDFNNAIGLEHDYVIALYAALNGSLKVVSDKLFNYRQHNKNELGMHKLSIFSKIRRILMHKNNSTNYLRTQLRFFESLLNRGYSSIPLSEEIQFIKVRLSIIKLSGLKKYLKSALCLGVYLENSNFKIWFKDLISE